MGSQNCIFGSREHSVIAIANVSPTRITEVYSSRQISNLVYYSLGNSRSESQYENFQLQSLDLSYCCPKEHKRRPVRSGHFQASEWPPSGVGKLKGLHSHFQSCKLMKNNYNSGF
jgi:hypothetical protein